MSINISIKRKFVVNGKEYGSVDEMPEQVRDAYKKAAETLGTGTTGAPHIQATSTKIVFNGQEYPDKESMPSDVRKMYEGVMQAVDGGKNSFRLGADFNVDVTLNRKAGESPALTGRVRPVGQEPLFSKFQLLCAGGAILLLLLYYLFFLAKSK